MEKIKIPKLTYAIERKAREAYEREMKRISKEEAKYIQFGFANGEVIDVDIEDVHEMELSGISEKHYVSPGYKFIEKYRECSKVEITLLTFANKEDNSHNKTCYTFDRFLSVHDIVDITYLNAKKEFLDRIYVPWDYSSRDFNSYQKTRKNKYFELEILIERGQ